MSFNKVQSEIVNTALAQLINNPATTDKHNIKAHATGLVRAGCRLLVDEEFEIERTRYVHDEYSGLRLAEKEIGQGSYPELLAGATGLVLIKRVMSNITYSFKARIERQERAEQANLAALRKLNGAMGEPDPKMVTENPDEIPVQLNESGIVTYDNDAHPTIDAEDHPSYDTEAEARTLSQRELLQVIEEIHDLLEVPFLRIAGSFLANAPNPPTQLEYWSEPDPHAPDSGNFIPYFTLSTAVTAMQSKDARRMQENSTVNEAALAILSASLG